MRLIFKDVPVIYGISSVAPLGPTAASLHRRLPAPHTHTPEIHRGPMGESHPLATRPDRVVRFGFPIPYSGHAAPALAHALTMRLNSALAIVAGRRLISYQRGRITVLDRPGLEARSCECYQVVKTEFDRLLPYVASSGSPPNPFPFAQ